MSVFPVVKGLKLRATKINSCGLPISGPQNRIITDGFVTVTISPVMKDAEELEQTNAEGKVCVTDRTPPTRKHYNVEAVLCNVNTGLISLLNGWPQVLDYEDNPIGFQDREDVEADFGVALEVWTGGKGEDDCPVPDTDSIFSSSSSGKSYGYMLIGAKEFTLGNIEIGAAISTFTLSGMSLAMPQWGRGPYNVAGIDANGTPGRLLVPVGKEAHFTLFRTPVAPPEATTGGEPQPLDIAGKFVDPDFYFGGPANAPAADVAPEQDEAKVTTVTISGAPTSGDFTLRVGGIETGQIAYDATDTVLKTAIGAVDDGIPESAWTVTGTGPWQITGPAAITAGSVAGLVGGTNPAIVIT
jgi:hypothetical protein